MKPSEITAVLVNRIAVFAQKNRYESSFKKFIGANNVYPADRDCPDTLEPLMSRIWVWRFRLHVFHKPDIGDLHDHPWLYYWTFPFVSYVEHVAVPRSVRWCAKTRSIVPVYRTEERLVRAWRPHLKRGDSFHRLLGRPESKKGPVVTLVFRGPDVREWGFLVNGNRMPWRKYLLPVKRAKA